MFMPTLAQVTDAVEEAAETATDAATGAEGAAGDVAGALQDLSVDDAGKLLDPDTLSALFQDYGMPLIWALVILVVTFLIAGIANSTVRRSMTKAKVDETLARFFGKMAKYLVLILGGIVALGKLGIEVTAFAAILAAAGFAVGMALSGTLGHFASGVMLLIFRPFKVGDVVNAAGVVGKVHEIELFTTALDTPDNRRIVVPNGAIYGSTIENVTFHDTRRVDVAVGCDYSASLDQTREVLDNAAKSVEGILTDPAHAIVLGDLGDSCVNWTVRVWCNTADYWAIKEATTRAVKQHLDDAGIGIPFPQMDVHMDKVGE